MPWSRQSTWDTEVGIVRDWGKELGAGREPGTKQWWEVMKFSSRIEVVPASLNYRSFG